MFFHFNKYGCWLKIVFYLRGNLNIVTKFDCLDNLCVIVSAIMTT